MDGFEKPPLPSPGISFHWPCRTARYLREDWWTVASRMGLDAFPVSVNSTPVSYAESEVMRYSVSFSYVRYVRERIAARAEHISPIPTGSTVIGAVNLGNGMYRVDRLVDGRTVSTIQSSDPGVGANDLAGITAGIG